MAGANSAQPRVSVVMPNYNHARWISSALDAIVKQSLPPDEVIVIDDCSTDNSFDLLAAYAKLNPIVRVIRNLENRGCVASMNRGLHTAVGDYVIFASADDHVLPGLFEKSLCMLMKYPQAGFCSAAVAQCNEAGERVGREVFHTIARKPRFISPDESIRALIRHGKWYQGASTFWSRTVLLREGGFDPELGSFQDAFMALVVAVKYGSCFVPEVLAECRVVAQSMSAPARTDELLLIETLSRGERLMKSAYADVFPAAFVRHFHAMSVRQAAGIVLLRLQEQQAVACRRLSHLLEGHHSVDSFALACHRLFMMLGVLLIHGYLLVRLQPLSMPVIIRNVVAGCRCLRRGQTLG